MPQPRSDFTMSIDSSDRKLYLFGGRTKIGISNEFWVYSIETKVWREIHGIGKPALNSSNVKSCIYTDESGYKYFILLTIQNNHFAIYKYSIDNNTWSMLANQGTIPPVRYGFSFECYNNSIIIWSGYPYKQDTFNPNTYLFYYKYNLDSESWSYPLPQGPPPPYRYLSGTCIYNNYLYIFYGYDPATMQDLDTISRVKLDESYQEWEDVRIDRSILDYKYIPRDSFQGVLVESYYYIFSGWNLHKIQNDFIRIELGKQYENREIVRLDRIHGEVIYPEGRIYASMQVFDNSLYVFGGLMQDESPTNQLWKYNILNQSWHNLVPKNDPPSPRSKHACTLAKDSILIFGGESEKGLLNDLYRYSVTTNTWTRADVRDSLLPSARRGACMTLAGYYLFIFGGWSAEGYNNDLWIYDPTLKKYRLINDGSGPNAPPKVANMRCEGDYNNGDVLLYIFSGDTLGLNPFQDIYYYNLTSSSWRYKGSTEYASSYGVSMKINSRIISIGGIQWDIYPENAIAIYDIDSRTTIIDTLPVYIFGASYIYYKDIIYIFSGGLQIDEHVTIRPTNNFYKLSLNSNCTDSQCWPCSKGTYSQDNDCKPCNYGTYSSIFGSESCQLCPEGSFGPYLAASDDELCLRCPEGSYNNKLGQKYCLDCPIGTYCPIGSTASSLFLTSKIYSSNQPTSFKSERKEVEEYSISIQISLGAGALVMILIVLAFSHLRGKVAKLDVFSEQHYNEDDKPMIKRQTRLGGLFSLSFLFIAITYSCTTFLTHSYDNIQEIKTLIPIVTLLDEVKSFIAYMEYSLELFSYEDECGYDGICTPLITLRYDNIQGRFNQRCYKVQNSCYIKITCEECEIISQGSVEFTSYEAKAYASMIKANITSFSSIPDQFSSISISEYAKASRVFRGSEATVFNFLLTPSYYESEVKDWESKTGYHVGLQRATVPGSSYEVLDIPFEAGLNVKLNIEISNSALYTLRNYKQTWVFMLFGLLGSVFGVMSALSLIMKLMEMMYKKRRDMHRASKNTIHLASALPGDQHMSDSSPFEDYSTPRATHNTERDHKGIFYMFRLYSPVRVVPTED